MSHGSGNLSNRLRGFSLVDIFGNQLQDGGIALLINFPEILIPSGKGRFSFLKTMDLLIQLSSETRGLIEGIIQIRAADIQRCLVFLTLIDSPLTSELRLARAASSWGRCLRRSDSTPRERPKVFGTLALASRTFSCKEAKRSTTLTVGAFVAV